MTSIIVSEHFSGPIAHPRHLREYEEICPGSAERIIKMAEDRNNHIMSMERAVFSESAQDQRRGMRYGAMLFAALIASALVTALMELHVAIPAIFLTTAALGAIPIFIKGRNGSD